MAAASRLASIRFKAQRISRGESKQTLFPHIKSGKVRILAISASRRLPQMPDVPTFAEPGLPDCKVRSGTGFMGPANPPRPVVTRLNAEINRFLDSPEGQKTYEALGVELANGSPEDMAQNIREELARWAGVVKNAGIKLEQPVPEDTGQASTVPPHPGRTGSPPAVAKDCAAACRVSLVTFSTVLFKLSSPVPATCTIGGHDMGIRFRT